MAKCGLSAQISVNNFLSHVLAGSSPGSLASMAGVLAYNLHGLDPDAARVRDCYLPNIRPAFERLKAGETLTSAEHASLILGLITFWNALSCLLDGLPPPVVSRKVVTQRLEALGLGQDAPLLSRSVLTRKPSEFAQRVRLESDIGPAWFRRVLKESRLWNEGATGASAAALYEFWAMPSWTRLSFAIRGSAGSSSAFWNSPISTPGTSRRPISVGSRASRPFKPEIAIILITTSTFTFSPSPKRGRKPTSTGRRVPSLPNFKSGIRTWRRRCPVISPTVKETSRSSACSTRPIA